MRQLQIKLIRIMATPTEAVAGGIAAGYMGFIKELLNDSNLRLVVDHVASSVAGASIFTGIATALLQRKLFLEAQRNNPDLTWEEFFTAERKKEACKFAANLGIAGGFSFFLFTLLAEGLHSMDSIGSKVIATVVGVLIFAMFNKQLNLGFPLGKMLQILMVFAGFAGGTQLLEQLALEPTVVAKYVLTPQVPAWMAMAAALVASLAVEFWLSKTFQAFGAPPAAVLTNGPSETAPLLGGSGRSFTSGTVSGSESDIGESEEANRLQRQQSALATLSAIKAPAAACADATAAGSPPVGSYGNN